jgi:hypothetical protein
VDSPQVPLYAAPTILSENFKDKDELPNLPIPIRSSTTTLTSGGRFCKEKDSSFDELSFDECSFPFSEWK